MIYAGANIQSPNDKLNKIQLEYLYNSLRFPKPDIVAKLRQLKIVRNLDLKQYSLLKRELPYVVCAAFSPLFRRTENFAYTEYFIVDLDHLSEKGLDINTVRARLQTDSRVMLSFISPSMDGLKVLFKLSERCYDAGIYSIFYKIFVKQLSIDMQLEQVVDTRTCDVCRACFISIDKDAYYNKDATPININDYLSLDDTSTLFDLKHKLDKEEKLIIKEKKVDDTNKNKDLPKDVLENIKKILNPSHKSIKPNAPIYVPEQVNEIIDELKQYIEETGVQIYEITNIQYGKKIKLKLSQRLAELNLFYGKRGFNCVISPRCGTNAEFNKLMLELVNSFIYKNL